MKQIKVKPETLIMLEVHSDWRGNKFDVIFQRKDGALMLFDSTENGWLEQIEELCGDGEE